MSSDRDDERLEGAPFLAAHDHSDTSLTEEPQLEKSLARPRRQFSVAFVIVAFLLLICTIFTLSGVALGFRKPAVEKPADEPAPSNHAAEEHEDEHKVAASVTTEVPVPTGTSVQYHEDIPRDPKIRDMSDYILESEWDLKAEPVTREYFWTITDAELNPDGVYRPMMLINNQFPGPLVRCNEGDRLIVHVENKAVNATAIHFHGMFQNGTNAMDGTVGITQCAIAPNSNFTYNFEVKGQLGTYWYHAHHSAQASDGLLGPVVVHSKNEPSLQQLDYETDRVLMFQDHYHNTTSEILMEYLHPDMENEEPVPDNALINGRGVRDCKDFPGWPCDSSDKSTLVIDLEKGKRHRLRIINVGAFAEFQIQVDEHAFHVTEVDGTDVRADEEYHRLNISPAQRYSIILDTNHTESNAFWMRARMVTHCFTSKNERLKPEIRAIIKYTSPDDPPAADVEDPQSKDWPEAIEVVCRDLNTSALHPVEAMQAPKADTHINLRASFRIGSWALARGFFNESTWHHNTTHPSLHRFLEAEHNITALQESLRKNTDEFNPEDDFVLQTSGIQTVDISINNFDDGSHPFHLHGHKFFVLVQGRSGYPPTEAELPAYLEKHGLTENPLRRDTVTVEGYAWAIIRVVLDNPGLWAFHCHNTWHSESGMVMQFLVQGEKVKDWTIDPEQKDLCSRKGVTKGMRPSDDIWEGWL